MDKQILLLSIGLCIDQAKLLYFVRWLYFNDILGPFDE